MFQLEYGRVLERRRHTKEDHEKLIQEELDKMEEELRQEKVRDEQHDPSRWYLYTRGFHPAGKSLHKYIKR